MFDQKNKLPKLIFIVEDNSVYAKTLELFLKANFEGLEVKTFLTGEGCIDNLYLEPDFIIMDYFLNGLHSEAKDGLSILREIKAKKPEAKIIVLSAQQDIKVALAVKEEKSMYLVKNSEAFENIKTLIL